MPSHKKSVFSLISGWLDRKKPKTIFTILGNYGYTLRKEMPVLGIWKDRARGLNNALGRLV
jgi:hypothetical protein